MMNGRGVRYSQVPDLAESVCIATITSHHLLMLVHCNMLQLYLKCN